MLKQKIKKLFHIAGIDIKKYSPPNYSWIKEKNINTILDIGANVGEFALFINKILPNVKIFAFEPLKKCYPKLLSNTKNLNCETYNIALGEENTMIEMNISDHLPSSSLLNMTNLHKQLFVHTQHHSIEIVEIMRLDDLMHNINLQSNVFIKIDVQGFEDKVIKGGNKTFTDSEIILIEMTYQILYEKQLLFDDIYRILYEMGFGFFGNLNQIFSPIDGKILYSDSIFLKRADAKKKI